MGECLGIIFGDFIAKKDAQPVFMLYAWHVLDRFDLKEDKFIIYFLKY